MEDKSELEALAKNITDSLYTAEELRELLIKLYINYLAMFIQNSKNIQFANTNEEIDILFLIETLINRFKIQ